MKYNPVIVVVAFNRPRSLERLLFSLKKAKNIDHARLIISIDNKEPENFPVRDLAMNFEWPFGEKEVIYQEKRLGLKQHVLKCGDLAIKYGSVIILEDDLFVSPYFYDYAVKALEYYDNDEKIGGISLYNHTYEDVNDVPFKPICDDSGVYFVQFPSSLGQAWTATHWTNFRTWFDANKDISSIPIHEDIIAWPETSWKKYFTAFLADTDRYFVFPRISLTTNFNDQGTHKEREMDYNGQAPLLLSDGEYRFKPLSSSFCVYDSYFEIMPEIVKHFVPWLKDYDFTMDLYGIKNLKRTSSEYVITSKPVKESVKSFMRTLKPHEMNVLMDLEGNDLSFCKKDKVRKVVNIYYKELIDFKYHSTSILLGKKATIIDYLLHHPFFSRFIKFKI